MKTITYYLKSLNLAMKSNTIYFTDFSIGVISVIVFNIVNLSLLNIIFMNFNSLNGWSFWELTFLYGFWLLVHSVYSLLFWHLVDLEKEIVDGSFDIYLIRPINPLVQFLGKKIHYFGIGDFLVSITILVLAIINLNLHIKLSLIFLFFIFFITGVIIEFSFSLILATVSFYFGKSNELFSIYWQISSMSQQYPINIYGKTIMILFSTIIPVGLINYYPSLILLGKNNSLLIILFIVSFSIVIFTFSLLFWNNAVKKYRSSGS